MQLVTVAVTCLAGGHESSSHGGNPLGNVKLFSSWCCFVCATSLATTNTQHTSFPRVAWSRGHWALARAHACHSPRKLDRHSAPGHHQSTHAQENKLQATGEDCIALGLPLTPTT